MLNIRAVYMSAVVIFIVLLSPLKSGIGRLHSLMSGEETFLRNSKSVWNQISHKQTLLLTLVQFITEGMFY